MTIMLININTVKDFALESRDGEIGKVKEFYFDDRHWAIRYLVAETGNWLTERQVLISPYALESVNKEAQTIAVNLTKKQIENSPALSSELPVSRQFESAYFGYYQWPVYWAGPYMWGAHPGMIPVNEISRTEPPAAEKWDPCLRSTHAVSGYHIHAEDGEIGHVDDFIIDDETWAIRYLVVNTSNWWMGKKVLISPQWLASVNWETSDVSVNLTRECIQRAPEYTDWSLLTREFEDCLHAHYERHGYWITTDAQTAGH
jgi:uncharacterized protein YrrD